MTLFLSEPPSPDASYDDAASIDLYRVRDALGDVDMTAPLMSDAHVLAVLSRRTTVPATVAALATELVMRYGREPVVVRTSDGLMVDYRERLIRWQALASAQSGGAASGVLSYPTFCPPVPSPTRGWRPD